MSTYHSGRHFLQIPGPTNVPDRVLRALSQPTIDHRSPEFAELTREILDGSATRLQDDQPGHHLSLVGHRRVGSGVCQHAVAGRQGAVVRDRRVRAAAGPSWRNGSGSRSMSWTPTGPAASIPAAVEAELAEDRDHRIKARSRRPQRDLDRRDQPAGRTFAGRSIARAIRRCCSSMPCRRWRRSICVRTSGASTSRSPVRRKG